MSQPSTRTVEVRTRAGRVACAVPDDPAELEDARAALEGRAYPAVESGGDVHVVVDVGAGVGAAALCLALRHPAARLLAFEPRPQLFRLLRRESLAGQPGVLALDFAPGGADGVQPWPAGPGGQGAEEVRCREAGAFFRARGVGAIDVLRIAAPGLEVPLLRALGGLLDTVGVLYLDYHSEADRLAAESFLAGRLPLAAACVLRPGHGRLCYAAAPLAPLAPLAPAASENAPELLSHTGRSPVAELYSVAVVVPTVLRPTLVRAARSVFAQELAGVGQLLVGVDRALGDRAVLDEVRALVPGNWALSVFDPGYSTSVRHGGLHAARDGGALRTLLSYAAHSRHVAYLDDDNWWHPEHLATLLEAVRGHDWAYSKRYFVDAATDEPLGEDDWESVGPGRGVFRDRFGGFVDPSTLLLDKVACEAVLPLWTRPLPGDAKGMSADRTVFAALRGLRGAGTGRPTCYYRLDPQDPLHAGRLEALARARASGTTG